MLFTFSKGFEIFKTFDPSWYAYTEGRAVKKKNMVGCSWLSLSPIKYCPGDMAGVVWYDSRVRFKTNVIPLLTVVFHGILTLNIPQYVFKAYFWKVPIVCSKFQIRVSGGSF